MILIKPRKALVGNAIKALKREPQKLGRNISTQKISPLSIWKKSPTTQEFENGIQRTDRRYKKLEMAC